MATIAELLQRALTCHQEGKLAEAEPIYRQVLRADPANAEAHHLLGLLAHQMGNDETALTLIRQASALNPSTPGIQFNLGIVLMSRGLHAEATLCFQHILEHDPKNVESHFNLGNAFFNQQKYAQAAVCYRQALRLNPNHGDAYHNLGSALNEQEQLSEAIECYRQALRINPNHADAKRNLTNARADYETLKKALTLYRQRAADPSPFQEVSRLVPHQAAAHGYLATALASLGFLREAWLHNEEVLRIKPSHEMARFRRSVLRLLQGDFAAAWQDFELRSSLPDWPAPAYQGPRWDGASIEGKTILVVHEQGFGDTLQFIRYLPLVKARGGNVVLVCQPALFGLLQGVPGADHVVTEGTPVPRYDLQVPLLSLPGIFKTTLDTIPSALPYLSADPVQIESWRKEFAADAAFNVGIVWQGNPKVGGDPLRSIPLAHFETLARVPGVRLVSLQKGPGTDQLRACPFPVMDLNERWQTFSDTAAVMKSLDLIVTSDTSTAHLAGALGVPVWTVLQLVPDWRWLLDRVDNPWYPTMRLFRQKRFGEWGEVFERMAEEIRRQKKGVRNQE